MSLNKKQPILILIIVLLILNGIHATEETDNSTIEQNNEYTVKTNNELKTTFNQITESTDKNYEINLEQKTYRLIESFKGSNDPTIEKNITINGNYSTIDCNNKNFLVINKNTQLTLKNITIRNAEYPIGSAIKNSGFLILENVKFENNKATDPSDLGGGAIFNDGSMHIINCTFTENEAKTPGSAIYINERVTTDTTVNIINSTFYNNHAPKGSTIFVLGNVSVNINNTKFYNENNNGTIIYNEKGNINLDNCEFYEDNSESTIINNAVLTVTNSRIYNNQQKIIIVNNQNLIIKNSEIKGNKVDVLIDNLKDTTITYTNISDNRLNESLITTGNILSNHVCNLNLNNSIVVNNTADKTCGIKNVYSKSHTAIDNSSFINNTSLLNEGILYDYNGEIQVLNSRFINNTSNNLFEGLVENFNLVNNNEYKGNNLNTYIKTNTIPENNQIVISGILETDEIYNTSINTGNIVLKQNQNSIYEEKLDNNIFNIYADINSNDDIILIYSGNNDFKNVCDTIRVSLSKENYNVTIQNIKENYVYGDYITFDLNITNNNSTICENILLLDIIPDELIYIDSEEEFDYENNKLSLSSLNINESKIIRFKTLPKVYDTLNFEFNIYDMKKEEYYSRTFKIEFIKPVLKLNPKIAHPGETINISGNLDNFNKNNIENIMVFFQNKEISNISFEFSDNNVFIKNFKLDDNLSKKNYNIEVICNESALGYSFSDTEIISVIKYDTYSLMDYNISGNKLNFSALIYDENNNLVNSGSVILKINGKSIKIFQVVDGKISLENYVLSDAYDEFTVSLTFAGNNKYNIHSNDIKVVKSKEEVILNFEYEIKDYNLFICVEISGKTDLPIEGDIAVKVNGISLSKKIAVINGKLYLTYDLNEFYNLNTLSVYYYGSNNYYEKISTVIL